MSVLGLNSKDRKSTRDKANISNPKVNRGCAPLTANRISTDCVQISFGPSIPYIPLGVYHTGGFNAMKTYMTYQQEYTHSVIRLTYQLQMFISTMRAKNPLHYATLGAIVKLLMEYTHCICRICIIIRENTSKYGWDRHRWKSYHCLLVTWRFDIWWPLLPS